MATRLRDRVRRVLMKSLGYSVFEDTMPAVHVLKMRMRFIVESDDGGFHAYCPDLQGLHVSGDTEEEALENAKCAARLYIGSLLKHDDPIPLGVVESHTRLGWSWSDLWRKICHARFHRKERSHVEVVTVKDVTLSAAA